MKQLQQKGFSAIEVIIVIVILGLLGGAGWLFIHKQNEDKTNSKTTKTSKSTTKTSQESTFEVPADFKTYTSIDGDYQISYPGTWGTLASTDGATIATSMIDNLRIGSSSQLDGHLTIAQVSSVVTKKYGATIKPVKDNSSYIWKVVEVNPADETDKVGDTYPVKSFKNAHNVTMYDFQYQDEDSIHKSYVLRVGNSFYQISLPSFWTADATTGDPTSISHSDLDQFIRTAKNIANSIQLK